LNSRSIADAHYTGTFEPERKTEDLVYGVTTQLHSWNPVYIQVTYSIQLSASLKRILNHRFTSQTITRNLFFQRCFLLSVRTIPFLDISLLE